jgi:hypothetical protein
MMSIMALAYASFALFVTHEFEEIIRCRPWIERHASDKRYARDYWIRNREYYPSTPALSACIAEEIVLYGVAMFCAGLLHFAPVVFAVTFANSLHLLGHLGFALRSRSWNPCSVTAAVTLPINIGVMVVTAHALDVVPSIIWTVVVTAVAGANLQQLHRYAGAVERIVRG